MDFTLEELNTNKEKRREYIMNDLHKKMEWLKENTDHNIIYMALQGSQTYHMDVYTEDYMSDIDVKAICIPSLDDIIRGNKMVSTTYIMDDNSHIDVKDIRQYVDLWRKGNQQFLEILFTDFYICNNLQFNRILDMADRIAFANKDVLLSCIKGIQMNKYKAMKHPYPTIKDKIDKYGYDCYTDDTKFLTRSGWKTYYEIKDGEEIGTLNPITKKLEFQKFYDRFCDEYHGKMYDVETYNSHFCVTPNHNVYTSSVIHINKNGHKYIDSLANWKLEKIEDIINTVYSKTHSSKHRHLAVAYNGNEDLLEYDGVEITDDLLKFIGSFVSDGTIQFKDGKVKSIRISQSDINAKHQLDFISMMDSINELKLNKYEYNPRDGLKNKEIAWIMTDKILRNKIYKWCNHGSKNKKLPQFIYDLSKRQAEILLTALCMGDGTDQKSRNVYYSTSKRLAEDVQILSLLSEKYANVLGGEKGYINKDRFSGDIFHIYQVPIKKEIYEPNWCYFKLGKNVKEINYNGNIVCFSVPNSVLITQKDGKIAIQGNSKQLHHICRLLIFASDIYVGGKSFREALIPEEPLKSLCLDLKTKPIPVEEADKLADDYISKLKNLADEYREVVGIHAPDEECYKIVDEIIYHIIYKEIEDKILGNK